MSTSRFDPKKPVDIFNPWPAHRWPIRKGRLVWVLNGGTIYPARVTWYHPAREVDVCWVVTPGRPFYGLLGKAWNGTHLARVEEVRPCSKKGLRELEELHLRNAANYRDHMRDDARRAGDYVFKLRHKFAAKWKTEARE